jgi:conjugal transfer pilus assembly protein TraB
MSLREQIKNRWVSASMGRFFNPETASGIRRLQFFWVICLCFVALGISYLIVTFLFEKSPIQKHSETLKPTPKTIETASHKVDLNEVWRHKVEDENKKLYAELKALKELFHEGLKDQQNAQDSDAIRDLEARLLRMEDQLENLGNKSEGQKQLPFTQGQFASHDPQNFGASLNGEEQTGKSIQKFSLGLSENPKLKQLKTVETTIPAGAFAKTVLLSGLDASASMTASSDPRPMLLRMIDPGTLPRRFQSDLKDCHCTASAFGDLSSERIYARLEKLTCIERKTGEIIETQVAGYIAGSDGKAGIRGIVASKDGQFLGRSLIGGVFAGLSNVANPQNRQSQVNPFFGTSAFPGSSQVSPPNMGQMFTSGMAAGASSALDRLSQYYIDRAEQLQPVIQVAAGQVVDIVFTEGTFIGSQNVKSEIEKTRTKARFPTSDASTEQGKENL